VSFLLHKLAISYDQQQREELLTALLDALHIDAEQREDSAASAKRSIRFDADKKRRRQSKPVDSKADPDIYSMGHEELQQYNRNMLDKLKRMLEERRAEHGSNSGRLFVWMIVLSVLSIVLLEGGR